LKILNIIILKIIWMGISLTEALKYEGTVMPYTTIKVGPTPREQIDTSICRLATSILELAFPKNAKQAKVIGGLVISGLALAGKNDRVFNIGMNMTDDCGCSDSPHRFP
jgi:hypothetical protein